MLDVKGLLISLFWAHESGTEYHTKVIGRHVIAVRVSSNTDKREWRRKGQGGEERERRGKEERKEGGVRRKEEGELLLQSIAWG